MMEKKGEKSPNFYIFGFQNVAKNIQILLIICTSYIIHSHIWLNLPRENCNFEYEPKFFQKRTLAKLIYKLGKGEGAIFYFSFKFCVVVLVAIIHLLVCIQPNLTILKKQESGKLLSTFHIASNCHNFWQFFKKRIRQNKIFLKIKGICDRNFFFQKIFSKMAKIRHRKIIFKEMRGEKR